MIASIRLQSLLGDVLPALAKFNSRPIRREKGSKLGDVGVLFMRAFEDRVNEIGLGVVEIDLDLFLRRDF